MTQHLINTIISYILPLVLGYLIKTIQTYSKREKTQTEALKCLLRSNITSKYYLYKELGYIPKYEKENINYMYEEYKKMKGNSYIDILIKEINNIPIK